MTTHNSTTLHDFLAQLDNHDWYYRYSSDHSVYTRGYQNEKRLMAIAESSPPHSILYALARNRGTELPQSIETTTEVSPKTLKEMGLSKDQSSKFQQLVAVPEEGFEKALTTPIDFC